MCICQDSRCMTSDSFFFYFLVINFRRKPGTSRLKLFPFVVFPARVLRSKHFPMTSPNLTQTCQF